MDIEKIKSDREKKNNSHLRMKKIREGGCVCRD
jgi:hypothetical protein